MPEESRPPTIHLGVDPAYAMRLYDLWCEKMAALSALIHADVQRMDRNEVRDLAEMFQRSTDALCCVGRHYKLAGGRPWVKVQALEVCPSPLALGARLGCLAGCRSAAESIYKAARLDAILVRQGLANSPIPLLGDYVPVPPAEAAAIVRSLFQLRYFLDYGNDTLGDVRAAIWAAVGTGWGITPYQDDEHDPKKGWVSYRTPEAESFADLAGAVYDAADVAGLPTSFSYTHAGQAKAEFEILPESRLRHFMRELGSKLDRSAAWEVCQNYERKGDGRPGTVEDEIPQNGGRRTSQSAIAITHAKEALALSILAKHPELSDAEIARRVNCHRTSLYRMKTYRRARDILKNGRDALPTGDVSDGSLDAWDEEESRRPYG